MPGTANFTYQRDSGGGGWKAAKYKPTADLYYLEGSLSLLDAETEWHYERATRKVYLKTRGNADPNDVGAVGGRVSCRVQEYAIAMMGVSHVVLKDIGFFATTAYAGGEGTPVSDHSIRVALPPWTLRLLSLFSHWTSLFQASAQKCPSKVLFKKCPIARRLKNFSNQN